MRNRRHRQDSGFALLIILLLAGVIAITLYRELPRIAFETQRQKEMLLRDRGEQYKRAIQVFAKANSRLPQRIEELESLNNRRYLRKRFIDPMTGKDEWRIVHAVNGVLTDSHTTKKKEGESKEASTAGQYVGEQVGLVGQSTNPNAAANGLSVAMRKRDSDSRPPGSGEAAGAGSAPPPDPNVVEQPIGGPGPPNGLPPGALPNQPIGGPGPPNGFPPGAFPNQPPVPIAGFPGAQPGSTGAITPPLPPGVLQPPGSIIAGRLSGQQMPGMQGVNGAPGNQQNAGGSYVGSSGPYVGGGTYIGSQPNAPGGAAVIPGQYPGNPVNSQVGGVSPTYGTAPGSNGVPAGSFQQPGMQVGAQGGAQGNAAAQMINQILTSPRAGMPITNPGAMMGSGIGGFASNADSDSIMVYNDQTNYGDWEFIFDPAKVRPVFNPVTGAVGVPAASMGTMPGGTPGTPVQQMQTPNGVQPAGMTPAGLNGGFGAGQPMGGFGPGQPMGGTGQQQPVRR